MPDDPLLRLRNINLDNPSEAIASILKSPRTAAMVADVTQRIAAIYEATVPVKTGNLKSHVFHYIALDGWGVGQKDRWFGYVGNNAVSYQGRKGVPYAAFIEYGKPSKGIFSGQHQLEHAARAVLGSDVNFGAHEGRIDAPRVYSKRDVNPKTNEQNYRNRKGQFTKSPKAKP